MNNFNIYTTEHLHEMQQEISSIIRERETKAEEEALDTAWREMEIKEQVMEAKRGAVIEENLCSIPVNWGTTSDCQECGGTFSLHGKPLGTKYCSRRCYKKAANKRAKIAREKKEVDDVSRLMGGL